MSGAVAVWVKTPGLSPVKTRLARSVGREVAEGFYLRSAEAVRAVVARVVEGEAGRLAPYWAVAEPESRGWTGFDAVPQGRGGLGERLATVYERLLARHDFAVFLGADAPQISPGLLVRALDDARRGDFVLGPADDGGFYLFAGSRPVPREAWTRVPYSHASTLIALRRELEPLGPVVELPPAYDVDTGPDLARLAAELRGGDDLLPEQRELAAWLAREPAAP